MVMGEFNTMNKKKLKRPKCIYCNRNATVKVKILFRGTEAVCNKHYDKITADITWCCICGKETNGTNYCKVCEDILNEYKPT